MLSDEEPRSAMSIRLAERQGVQPGPGLARAILLPGWATSALRRDGALLQLVQSRRPLGPVVWLLDEGTRQKVQRTCGVARAVD